MQCYQPLYKKNQLKYGLNDNLIIITGWTDKDIVAKKFEFNIFLSIGSLYKFITLPFIFFIILRYKNYAAIGNLYSPARGLSFILRNLLANPQIRYVISLSATPSDKNSGSVDALTSFFHYGFEKDYINGKPYWVTYNGKGVIDYEISEQALNTLRKHIFYANYSNLNLLADAVQNQFPFEEPYLLGAWGEPMRFPDPVIETTTLPGNRYGHIVRGDTVAETWVKLIQRIRKTGTIRPTGYDGKWQELIDLVAIVKSEPIEFYFPEPNYLPTDRKYLESYIPQILEDAEYDYDGKVKYTYGQRLRSWFYRDQIEEVIEKLISEIDSASAVMNLWDSGRGFNNEISTAPFGRLPGESDHQHGGSPCLNHIWLRVVEGELSMTATFRSNDMFSAWPANAMGLIALQRHIRDEIAKRSEYDLTLGPLITVSQSAHIYDDCWENADSLIKSQYHNIIINRQYDDPVGKFIIDVNYDDKKILVEHQNDNGETVEIYEGNTAKKLYQKIAENNPVIETKHALYLGTELQKAEFSLKYNTAYRQDR